MFCWIAYILIFLIAALYSWGYIYKTISGVCTSTNRMDHKTVIITGSSAGIGKEAAKDLAMRGARVILACRNVQKAEAVKDWIIAQTANENVVVRQVDVSNLDSVRKFASETLATENRLDILVNNAGGVFHEWQESKQGFELNYATNHLGHFLLTHLLLGLLIKSSPSRIVNVSSVMHKYFDIDLDDIQYKKRKYGGMKAYSQSKLCNILFTMEFAHKLSTKGVTVNSLHPGVVKTEIANKYGTPLEVFIDTCLRVFAKDAELGAQTIIHLAVSDEVKNVTGEYFVDCKVAQTSQKAQDPGLAKKLWEISETDAGLKSEERHI